MYRHWAQPREDWRRTIERQGMTFPTTKLDGGGEVPYWNEAAMYEFSTAEIDHLESATADLHTMSVEATKFLLTGAMGDLGLPAGTLEMAQRSLDSKAPSLYGRFDLAYDGDSPAKLLEYNADTPVTLIETAVIQWHWLNDKFPNTDQWNSVHEDLVKQWRRIWPHLRSRVVHIADMGEDAPNEDIMTAGYLMDTAVQAGLTTKHVALPDIGYDRAHEEFVDEEYERIDVIYKLYPWSDMLWEPFGEIVIADPDLCQWIEPPWKVVMASKALLPALWHLYPNHENLLPAYFNSADELTDWVAKPLHGREGDGIVIRAPGVRVGPADRLDEDDYVYQKWCPLPDFDGNHPVIGSWVIGGRPAGIGIRESDGWITDFYSRFVPHVIDAPRPSDPELDPLT